MQINTHRFSEIAEKELKNRYSRRFLDLFRQYFAVVRKEAMKTFPDPEAALSKAAAIRTEAVARLPELLEQFEKNAIYHGAKVFWARDAKEANTFILNLAKERGIAYVTKGKSMVTEELGLNQVLIENGIDVFESDLGEFIAQQLGRPPFHIVGPVVNVPTEEISNLFMKTINMKEPTRDPVQLGLAARLFLRDKFHHLKMGITGVNFAVAETGTIINVENEGNIRLTKSSPKTQVSVMTLEKVIPSLSDAMHLLRVLCRSCTGQKISAYVSMDTGPKRKDEKDGPEELFIVIVDNGRSDIYHDVRSREALQCIRCGACLNVCPVYTKIGGYPYGWVYSGPMGQVLNPLLLGLDKTRDLYRASTHCGACKRVCPAGIDHPGMFLSFRRKEVEGDPQLKTKARPFMGKTVFNVWTFLVTKPRIWRLSSKIVRLLVNKTLQIDFIRNIKGPLERWTRCRDLLNVADKTFHERWKSLKSQKVKKQKGM